MVGGPDTVERIVELTGGFGADYTFEATGNVAVMRQAVESARMGWGLCTVAGVAGKGETLDIVPRFLITGRRVAGSSFGGVKGRDGVPVLVERWLAGDIDVDVVHLAPADARRGEPRLRADGGAGRHPERDPVRMIIERAEHPAWTSNAYLVADARRRTRRARRLERRRGAAARTGRVEQHHDHARARHASARATTSSNVAGLARRFGVPVVGIAADEGGRRADRDDDRRRRRDPLGRPRDHAPSRRPVTAPTTSRCS